MLLEVAETELVVGVDVVIVLVTVDVTVETCVAVDVRVEVCVAVDVRVEVSVSVFVLVFGGSVKVEVVVTKVVVVGFKDWSGIGYVDMEYGPLVPKIMGARSGWAKSKKSSGRLEFATIEVNGGRFQLYSIKRTSERWLRRVPETYASLL